MINVEATVGMVRAMELRIAEEEKAFKEKMKPLNDFADDCRNQLLKFLTDTGQRNAATKLGTAYIADKESYRIEDRSEFQRHVIGTQSWEMIDWRANRTAMKEFEKTETGLPPGVAKTTIKELRVLGPVRKKTTTNLKVVGGSEIADETVDEQQETGFD